MAYFKNILPIGLWIMSFRGVFAHRLHPDRKQIAESLAVIQNPPG